MVLQANRGFQDTLVVTFGKNDASPRAFCALSELF